MHCTTYSGAEQIVNRSSGNCRTGDSKLIFQYPARNATNEKTATKLRCVCVCCVNCMQPLCMRVCWGCHVIGSTLIARGDCHQHIEDKYDMLVKVTRVRLSDCLPVLYLH